MQIPAADLSGVEGPRPDDPSLAGEGRQDCPHALCRLAVADVDRGHTRLRAAGVGESSLRNQHLVVPAASSVPAWTAKSSYGRVSAMPMR